jgi:hypothetical protein
MMEHSLHSLGELFKQPGPGSSHDEIENFLSEHAQLPTGMLLSEAPFWSSAQAAISREAGKQTVTGQRLSMP